MREPRHRARELASRPLGGLEMPYLWVDTTYVKCRRDDRVPSTAVAIATGCNSDGRRTRSESTMSTRRATTRGRRSCQKRGRGAFGASARHLRCARGLRRVIAKTFQEAAWQRCAVHLMRDCARAAGSRGFAKRVSRIVAPVFRLKSAGAVRAAYHIAIDMLEERYPEAADPRGGGVQRAGWCTPASRRPTGSACTPTTSKSTATGR